MADAQTVTDAPRKAAKGLSGVFKGKPAWVWIAGITVLIGVAYLAYSRKDAQDPGNTADPGVTGDLGDDLSTDGYYDYGVPTYTSTGSEGAYGGYDQPQDFAPIVSDNAGNPEPSPSPITVNVSYPAPTGGGKPAATGTAVHAPVAGGAHKWEGHPLSWWKNPMHASKMVKIKGRRNKVRRWRWPGDPHGSYRHTRAFRGGHG